MAEKLDGSLNCWAPTLRLAFHQSRAKDFERRADVQLREAWKVKQLSIHRPRPFAERQRVRQEEQELGKAQLKSTLTLALSFGTFVLALVAFVPWLLEGGARHEERQVRRAALVESAFRAIAELQPAEGERLVASDRLQWAINTLARYGQPVTLEAEILDLNGLDIVCADIVLRANEVRLRDSRLDRSRLAIDGNKATLDIDARRSFIIAPSSRERSQTATYVTGVLENSILHSPGRAIINLYGKSAAVSAGPEDYFIIDGTTVGPVSLIREELSDTIWPLEVYANISDAEALPGESWNSPPLHAFEFRSDANAQAGISALRFNDGFLTLCPSGRCVSDQPLPDIHQVARTLHSTKANCSVPEVDGWWWRQPPDFDRLGELYIELGRSARAMQRHRDEMSRLVEGLGGD